MSEILLLHPPFNDKSKKTKKPKSMEPCLNCLLPISRRLHPTCFITDEECCMKQICLQTTKILKNFGKIWLKKDHTSSMFIDNDNLFISNIIGDLKIFSIIESKLKKEYTKLHSIEIVGIYAKNDILITADASGSVIQWSLSKEELLYEYP